MSDSSSAGAAASPPAIRACLNCGAALAGRWCAACGQEDRPLDLTLRDVLAEAWEAVTNLEGPVYRSLARLFSAPGFLTREYLAGRRARWVSPMRLYLVVSVVYFGLTSLTGWGAIDFEIRATGGSAAEVQRELEELGFANEAELYTATRDAVGTWMPRAMFLLLPVFAGLMAIAHRAARWTYPRHLVFALHVHAAVFTVLAVTAALTGPFGSEGLDEVVQGAAVLYALVYLVIAQRAVYGGSRRRSVVLGLAVGATYWVLIIAVTLAILLPIVLAVN